MNAMQRIGRKLAAISVLVAATCFGHGSCSQGPLGFFDEGFDYVEEWYEDTFYYEDDYYYDDWDCCGCDRGCDDGWGFWLDWF
ncbi:MAG: hypothetical protein JSU68_10590 [Phycisphaerales bacterium]|nr:MAG: hypothetical protein JSU68_10590 [Phycisphaerales bacterium]